MGGVTEKRKGLNMIVAVTVIIGLTVLGILAKKIINSVDTDGKWRIKDDEFC